MLRVLRCLSRALLSCTMLLSMVPVPATAWEAGAPGCTPDSELLSFTANSAELPNPCSHVGYYFAWASWGNAFSDRHPPTFAPDFERWAQGHAFEEASAFMAGKLVLVQRLRSGTAFQGGRIQDPDSEALLTLMLVAVRELDAIESERAPYYWGFLIDNLAFLDPMRRDELSNVLSGIAAEASLETGYASRAELECFIASDLPSVNVEAILSSNFYRSCVSIP